MFNAEEYFERVEKHLASCRATTVGVEMGIDGPHFFPTRERWEVITLNALIKWPSGEILDVLDTWQRRRRNTLMRTFSYHFMHSTGGLIFRLDTHGEEIPYDGKCHIHVRSGARELLLEDDDSRLHGFRLSEIDFLNAFALVHTHLKKQLGDKVMPWDEQ
jgi:hypothetical protein